MTDTLHRFIFDDTDVRGNVVHLSKTFNEVLQHHQYPATIRHMLGELMAASALLIATLKIEGGALVLQIQGKGAIQLLVVECKLASGAEIISMRATATIAENTGDSDLAHLSFAELVGAGHFAITLDPQNGSQAYQGIVPIEGKTIAEILQNYMQRSEQIDTRIWLASNDHTAAGMLLQKLPQTNSEDKDAWNRLIHLADTVEQQELLSEDSRTLLFKLFNQENVRVFKAQHVQFNCSCSQHSVGNMLKLLGRDEAQSILDEHGKIEVNCSFCNQQYTFDSIDIKQLFDDYITPSGSQSTH